MNACTSFIRRTRDMIGSQSVNGTAFFLTTFLKSFFLRSLNGIHPVTICLQAVLVSIVFLFREPGNLRRLATSPPGFSPLLILAINIEHRLAVRFAIAQLFRIQVDRLTILSFGASSKSNAGQNKPVCFSYWNARFLC